MKAFKEFIDESSLSRIWKHNIEHDCGAMTAFRKYNNCGYNEDGTPCDDEEPIELTKQENNIRNKSLLSDLIKLGYGTTRLLGQYPEGGKSVKEVSYFIVDLEDKGTLEKDLKKLGEKYDQDSVLFIPKGAINNDASAYLIGTNKCCNSWPGYGKKDSFNKGKLGYNSPIYTSVVNGRPFIFESVSLNQTFFESGSQAQAALLYSNKLEK